jgi:hypothetical protein
MSEHDANRALSDTARLRMLPEPVEDAQPMTFSERQYRAREARGLMVAGLVADSVEAQINTIARSIINVETASGAALDALAGIKRPAGMTDEVVRNLATQGYHVEVEGRCPPVVHLTYLDRSPDFREHSNGTLRREHRLSVHEIAQQDGFPGDDIQ